MDLASSITALNHANTMARIQFTVARKILDQQQMQGNAAVRLIDAATKPLSQAGDAVVAAATGLGGALDTYG